MVVFGRTPRPMPHAPVVTLQRRQALDRALSPGCEPRLPAVVFQ